MCVEKVNHQIVKSLVRLRKDWEVVADGRSLVDFRGSIGLLLNDAVAAVGLTSEEKAQVLGDRLSQELQETMSVRYCSVELG